MKVVKKYKLDKYSEFDEHEGLYECIDSEANLNAFIAIHNTGLGPATGGTRFMPYDDKCSAIQDVFRLSKAMTYKCALADMPFGGGKGVIVGDPAKIKSKKLLRSYSRFVNKLKGSFSTGEDVGIDNDDVEYMLKYSDQFNGRPDAAIDPSPLAALSTYVSIKFACREILNIRKLDKVSVAIKGMGKVGNVLAMLLLKDGCILYISDIDESKLEPYRNKKNVMVSRPNEVLFEDVDIVSPCALAHDLTPKSVVKIKAKVVCGAANNQLESEDVGRLIHSMGKVYIPDFIANSGGLINVIDERNPRGYSISRVKRRVYSIEGMLTNLLVDSMERNLPLFMVANKAAQDKFQNE